MNGWKELSSFASLFSLFSWAAIILATFIAAIAADMAGISPSLIITIGATAFILVTFLVIVILGSQQETEGSAETLKIPLTQLREEAINLGWDFSEGSEQSLTFTLAISQAGLDCAIQFWGRKNSYDSESQNRNNQLIPIPAGHWLQFAVEPVRFVSSEDNFQTRSYKFPSMEVRAYLDLHANREQAMQWLTTTAEHSRNRALNKTP